MEHIGQSAAIVQKGYGISNEILQPRSATVIENPGCNRREPKTQVHVMHPRNGGLHFGAHSGYRKFRYNLRPLNHLRHSQIAIWIRNAKLFAPQGTS